MKEITAKKRGRPREFDAAVALQRATQTFLRYGYAGASLETLTGAMGLSKPSLYAAFKDKRALFQRVVEERAAMLAKRYRAAFKRGTTLETSLVAMFDEAVTVNLGEEGNAPGCLIVSSSTTEAVEDEALAKFTREFFAICDQEMARWIEQAYGCSSSKGALSAQSLGRLVNTIIHDISLRARVGESRTRLRAFVRDSARALSVAAGAGRGVSA